MSTLRTEKAIRAWHKCGRIWISLSNGTEASFPVSSNRVLAKATHRELNNIEISPFGLHWPDLDEDLSTSGIIAGRYGNNHGGKRSGAGRKPSNHVRVQLNIRPESRQKIQAYANRKSITLSQAVDEMVSKIKIAA